MKRQEGSRSPECVIILFGTSMAYSGWAYPEICIQVGEEFGIYWEVFQEPLA